MTRPLLITLILVAYIIYVSFKYKETWKKLTLWQIAGVFVTFVGVASISAIILFYGSRYITSAVPGDIMVFIIQFLAVIIVIAAAAISFALLASKITNGVIPIERRGQK
ncbi:hypothetical protein [Lentibacillus salinarum]|uniref:Uncharacterized protein n=1 Tax=Lentibacillus salinarum TaxID=446820 RepID=A0ABW3ZT25_9BACI